ncbi:MAG TPA: hypothetical protein DDY13_09410 [Cytophagales bacterium]|nr:hypothetical protein [Cytophagales bacterium]
MVLDVIYELFYKLISIRSLPFTIQSKEAGCNTTLNGAWDLGNLKKSVDLIFRHSVSINPNFKVSGNLNLVLIF